MHKDVKFLRSVLKDVEGAWVRRWRDRDGTIRFWAGAHGILSKTSTERGMKEVCNTLDSYGIKYECKGKNDFIVDVYLNEKE